MLTLFHCVSVHRFGVPLQTVIAVWLHYLRAYCLAVISISITFIDRTSDQCGLNISDLSTKGLVIDIRVRR